MDEKREFFYRELEEIKVNPKIVKEAKKVLDHCREILKLPEIKIQWCEKVDKADYDENGLFSNIMRALKRLNKNRCEFWGQINMTSPNVIWARADISLKEVIKTVAHECKHLSDFRRFGRFNRYEEEKRAEEFAQRIMTEIKMRKNNQLEV